MDDGQLREVRLAVRALQRRLIREASLPDGMSGTAFRVLRAVARLGDGCGPSAVAEETRMTSSNVAAALRELEGFVLRSTSRLDSRRAELALTERGRELIAASRAERDEWLGRAVDGTLTPGEQAALADAAGLLARLAAFEDRP